MNEQAVVSGREMTGNRMAKLLCVLSALVVLSMASVGFVGAASACSYAGNDPFPAERQWRQDDPPAEATFPDAVTLELLEVVRGQWPKEEGTASSCGIVGNIRIGVSPHDVTDYGLQWRIVEGTSPAFIPSLNHPLQVELSFLLFWGERKDRMQTAYDFQITATWVDAWGREGNTSEPLLIHVPAAEDSSESSCSHVAGGSSPVENGLVWMGLGVMALVVRRKFF